MHVNGDAELAVGSEPRQVARVDGDSTDQIERLAGDMNRVRPCENEEGTLGRGGTNHCHAAWRGKSTDAVELVAEMAGRHHAPLGVLNLQEIQTRQRHSVAGVIEDIPAIIAAHDRGTEVIIRGQLSLDRVEPRADSVLFAREVGTDDRYQ